jgi:hypothetical protein
LAHRQSIHIPRHRRHKRQKAQMSDFYGWLQAHSAHTHLAHLIPNQHTLTCRSINDLVLKRPAYPQIEDILGSYPFLSPMERAYLGLCGTARCEAETLFLDSFATISPPMEQVYFRSLPTRCGAETCSLTHSQRYPPMEQAYLGLCNTTKV